MTHNQKPRNAFCVYLVVCWRRSSYDKHTSLHLQPTSIPRTSLVMSLWAWPIYPLLWLCSLLVLKTRFLDKIKMRKWSATKNDEWHLWTSLGVNRRKGNIQVKHHKFSLENEKKKRTWQIYKMNTYNFCKPCFAHIHKSASSQDAEKPRKVLYFLACIKKLRSWRHKTVVHSA